MSLVVDLQTAAQVGKKDKAHFIETLNTLFRAGTVPTQALNGRLVGSLVLLHIGPGFNQLVEALTANNMPWKGKTFNADKQTGDNVFAKGAVPLAHVLWPFYRDIVDDGPETVRAFKFKTYTGAGMLDPDRTVFKIDYDSPDNPGLTIRRVLDEIVQFKEGVYLGKAHLKWWWGSWQTVAYFMLEAK
jgi:hypothetical protein